MRATSLFVSVACLLLAQGASAAPFLLAQADADAGTAPAGPASGARKSKSKSAGPAATDAGPAAGAAADAEPTGVKPSDAQAAGAKVSKKKGKGKRGKKGAATTAPAAAPAPAPAPALTPPPPAAQTLTAPPPPPTPELLPTGPEDNDPPTISHTAVTRAMKSKPLIFTARITDPSGVFQPVLYLRKRGTGDYIPLKMVGSKLTQGDYIIEVPEKLITVDLEYYIECWDNAGNGPARAGSPENPFAIKLEEPPRPTVIVKEKPGEAPKQTVIVNTTKGAPPAITHSAVAKAIKGQPVEISARLGGETGVSGAKVMFRRVGEGAYRELPMGDIGGENYTATIPASVVQGDLEYYLEAFDKNGIGPGRSGAPSTPYKIEVAEKVVEAPKNVIVREGGGGQDRFGAPPPPRLVKPPFKPNFGRAFGWLAMTAFVGSTIFAGGEALGAYQADTTYHHTFEYDGRLLPELHQRSLDYNKRAKIFGIVAVASLVLGITLLAIFPDHPETVIAGSGGDLTVARF